MRSYNYELCIMNYELLRSLNCQEQITTILAIVEAYLRTYKSPKE